MPKHDRASIHKSEKTLIYKAFSYFLVADAITEGRQSSPQKRSPRVVFFMTLPQPQSKQVPRKKHDTHPRRDGNVMLCTGMPPLRKSTGRKI